MVGYVLDKHWENEGPSYGKKEGDPNAYTPGLIGEHNVVVAHMPGMGSNRAAMVAQAMKMSFKHIKLAIVVGICGVVPFNFETKRDIVLGDCIISTAVAQYDFGKQYPLSFVAKASPEDILGHASAEFRSLTAKLSTDHNQERLTKRLGHHLEELLAELLAKEKDVKYPGAQRDLLFQPDYSHQHRNGEKMCGECLKDSSGICTKDCNLLGCEESQLVRRKRLESSGTSATTSANLPPIIHFGPFGSANTVMKSGLHRDNIARKRLLAFEMEGSGVWDIFQTIVIKSGCDYADSHKSKEWQPYAAATAAAGLKALLEEWVVVDEERSSKG